MTTVLNLFGVASAAQITSIRAVLLAMAHVLGDLMLVDGMVFLLVLVMAFAYGGQDRRAKRLAQTVDRLAEQRDDLRRRLDRLEARIDAMGWTRPPEARG